MKRAEFGRHSSGTYVRGHAYVEKELYGCQGPMWDQVVSVLVLAVYTYFFFKVVYGVEFLGQERAIDSFVLKKFPTLER